MTTEGGEKLSDPQQVDAGHISFLELIRVISTVAGAPFAAGALLKTGLGVAKQVKATQLPDFAAFVASVEAGNNLIASFEGRARYYRDGVFGLPTCPFAQSIQAYRGFVGAMPGEYGAVTDQLNRRSSSTEKLRVGQGAAVSPFCGVHQPLRSALAETVLVGGKPLVVYQLGCKSGAGVKGLSAGLIAETGIESQLVEEVLDENMCCYCVRVSE